MTCGNDAYRPMKGTDGFSVVHWEAVSVTAPASDIAHVLTKFY
jgi:hypothetical protein